MGLDQIKELTEKGLTNAAIAEVVNLSIRQVQRLKRRLLETPVKLPKTSEALIKLLQKKAAQGDLIAIRTLLKEYATTDQEEEKIPTFPWWFFWLAQEERNLAHALIARAEQRQQGWPHKARRPILSDIEAMAEAEKREDTPTPPSSPSRGSTSEEAPKPSALEVGNTPGESDQTHSHLVNTPEGRELPPSPLVKHEKVCPILHETIEENRNRKGGLQILKEK